MWTEITLEVKVRGNQRDLNNCHPYCNYLHAPDGKNGVLCRLFRTEGYLKTDTSGPAIEFRRCDGCISAQREVRMLEE